MFLNVCGLKELSQTPPVSLSLSLSAMVSATHLCLMVFYVTINGNLGFGDIIHTG